MGSLNNGNRINQSRESIRNIGGFQTFYIDRIESSGIRDVVQLGTTSDSFASQYSVVAISDIVKTTNNTLDSYRERTSSTGSAVPVDGLDNPNPFLLPESVGSDGGNSSSFYGSSILVNTYSVGPVTLASSGSNTVSTNRSAVTEVRFNLPAASGGLVYDFAVESASGLKIVANGTDTIRMSSAVTAAGGNIVCSGVGGYATLVCLGTSWFSRTIVGPWVVT